MKAKRRGLIRIILIAAIFLFTIPLISSTSLEYTSSSEVVILFDEAHGQFCRLDEYKGNYILALTLLNMSARYQVRVLGNGSSITPLRLLGVDILVIGNPGINDTYDEKELNTISTFALMGGSILLMSEGYVEDIYPLNQSIPNHTELNKILKAVGVFQAKFTNLNHTIRDVSQWLYYYAGDTHQIPIPGASFSPQHTVGMGIDTVLMFGSHIDINPFIFSSNIMATGRTLDLGTFIYPLSTTASETILPIWLAGFQLFSSSRILLCGSTMMFSDIAPRGMERIIKTKDKNITLASPWYFAYDTSDFGLLFGLPSFDNAKLWMNMFDWLSISENQNFLPLIIAFFVGMIGIIGIGFTLFIYAKRIKIKEIKIEISEKEKEELPTVLERAETLKSARRNLKIGEFSKAAELYIKASKLSSKIRDDVNRKKFNKKARDIRSSRKLK
ncbi:MAG: hypothetical protein HWN67_12865 [Candidatus Helarchaeota archaeon]|nr:hypothetical protein [Candidatus Helarchaeota archaeon]